MTLARFSTAWEAFVRIDTGAIFLLFLSFLVGEAKEVSFFFVLSLFPRKWKILNVVSFSSLRLLGYN